MLTVGDLFDLKIGVDLLFNVKIHVMVTFRLVKLFAANS